MTGRAQGLPSCERYEQRKFDSNSPSCTTTMDNLSHQFAEILEQVAAIMRSRGRLGVILHAKEGTFAVAHPFKRPVIQVDVRRLDIRWESGRIHCKTVVLRGD